MWRCPHYKICKSTWVTSIALNLVRPYTSPVWLHHSNVCAGPKTSTVTQQTGQAVSVRELCMDNAEIQVKVTTQTLVATSSTVFVVSMLGWGPHGGYPFGTLFSLLQIHFPFFTFLPFCGVYEEIKISNQRGNNCNKVTYW